MMVLYVRYKNMANKENESLKTECITPSRLSAYLSSKSLGHTCFKVYTTQKSLDYRVQEDALFLSTGGNWNDTRDRDAFNPQNGESLKFGACFSFSKSESVAMWMLYGGVQHTGVMIDYRQRHMKQILSNTELVHLGVWDRDMDCFIPIQAIGKDQFQFRLMDILYMSYTEGLSTGCQIWRSDETIKLPNIKIIKEANCLTKTSPWRYENECRLILTVPRNILKDSKINSAKITLPGIYSELFDEGRVYASPEYQGSHSLTKSALESQIAWDLCYSCSHLPKDPSHNQE